MGERAKDFKQQLAYEEQRSLYDYWRSKCRPGVLPTRRDLHPRGMIKLLPFITLTDVSHDNERPAFRVRLAGTGLRTILDTEMTGQTLESLPLGHTLSHWTSVHEKIVAERTPLCGVMPLVWHGKDTHHLSSFAHFWVKFPLVDESGAISTILAYDIFTPLSDLSPGLKLGIASN
jgi:hypothetical protein